MTPLEVTIIPIEWILNLLFLGILDTIDDQRNLIGYRGKIFCVKMNIKY